MGVCYTLALLLSETSLSFFLSFLYLSVLSKRFTPSFLHQHLSYYHLLNPSFSGTCFLPLSLLFESELCLLYKNIKQSFPAANKKKICFFFLSGSLLLCSAAPTTLPPSLPSFSPLLPPFPLSPPPSPALLLLALLSFQLPHPSQVFQPSIYPLENRGHCTNDYSDPGRHGNAAVTGDRHASSAAKMVISKLVMEKASAAFVQLCFSSIFFLNSLCFSVCLQLTGVEGMREGNSGTERKPANILLTALQLCLLFLLAFCD